jgi:hypothetical protein
MCESDWPSDVKLRTLHELWYEGNKHKRFSPYKFANTLNWRQSVRKLVSFARNCIAVIDVHLLKSCDDIAAYLSLTDGRKDETIKAAYVSLCKELIEHGHPSSETVLMYKLMYNNYNSLYENDFKYLRSKSTKK